MIFTVIQNGAKMGNRKTRQIAARRRFANPAFDGRNPVLGNRPAENIVYKFDALVALAGLKLDAAYAELPVSARLLLVLALGIRLAANGFAVRNLGQLSVRLTL